MRFFLANRTGGGRSTTDALLGIRCSWSGDVFNFMADADTDLSVLIAKRDTSVAISASVEVNPNPTEAAQAAEALTGPSTTECMIRVLS